MKKKRILYLTGSRADFGLIKETLIKLNKKDNYDVRLIVTGQHLLKKYGNTIFDIKETKLLIIGKIPVELNGTKKDSVPLALAEQIKGITSILKMWKPNFLILLGDRGEMLAGAIAASYLLIPIIHIHGGERSGTIDESIRHAISKLANFHLVSTKKSKERLIKMGEREENITITGAPGLDEIRIKKNKLKSKNIFCKTYDFSIDRPIITILFHPVLQEVKEIKRNLLEIIKGISLLSSEKIYPQLLVLSPNSDAGGALIDNVWVEELSKLNLETRYLKHLPREEYLSALKNSDVLLGNSSSGIIESASFGLPVLDLGSRQKAREKNANVMSINISAHEIKNKLIELIDLGNFQINNLYGNGFAGDNIISAIDSINEDQEIIYKINSY